VPLYTQRRAGKCQKGPSHSSEQSSLYVSRDLKNCKARRDVDGGPVPLSRPLVRISVKRDLCMCQKRPMCVSKET